MTSQMLHQVLPFQLHPYTRTIRTTATVLLLSALYIPSLVYDYRAFQKLSEIGGGPLRGVTGWLFASALRPFKRETISVGEYERDTNQRSWLEGKELPERAGERPRFGVHPVPHRQLDQAASAEIAKLLSDSIKSLQASNPTLITTSQSVHEGHIAALFIHPSLPSPHTVAEKVWREIAHVHSSSESSAHVVLSPADCKKVIEKKWGERHACSGRIRGLTKEYVIIYSPRNEEEVKVVRRIIEAACGFMTGGEVVCG